MRVGSYETGRQLGGGGMTTVYQAVDTHFGRAVALKLVTLPPNVPAAQRQELLTRWRREARALGNLSHPNIVTVHDVGTQDGYDFLVMEYLEGRNLRHILEQGPLPVAEASPILDQVAAGLDAVHAHGLVLRDLKPSKVMLLPDGRAKLTSLGLARHADDTMVTQAGERIGSPAFMAPEQVRGEAATPATDLWSLGTLLYAMLAGRPPFAGPTVDAMLYQITTQPPPPVPDLPAPIQAVVTRALQKDPARRYGSGGELAAALRAAATGPAQGEAVAPPPRERRPDLGASVLSRLPRSPLVWLVPLLLVVLLTVLALRHPLGPGRGVGPVPPPGARATPTAPVSVPPPALPRPHPATPRRPHKKHRVSPVSRPRHATRRRHHRHHRRHVHSRHHFPRHRRTTHSGRRRPR